MRFRKDPGRPGPVGALAECFGGTAVRWTGGGPALGTTSWRRPRCSRQVSVAPAVRQGQPQGRHRPREPPDAVRDRGGALRPPMRRRPGTAGPSG